MLAMVSPINKAICTMTHTDLLNHHNQLDNYSQSMHHKTASQSDYVSDLQKVYGLFYSCQTVQHQYLYRARNHDAVVS